MTTIADIRAALAELRDPRVFDDVTRLLAALPSDGVIVTEEELAAALDSLDTGPDGGEYSHTYAVDSPEAFAAAILAALRKESGDE